MGLLGHLVPLLTVGIHDQRTSQYFNFIVRVLVSGMSGPVIDPLPLLLLILIPGWLMGGVWLQAPNVDALLVDMNK